MIRSREGQQQRLVRRTKNTFQSEATSTQERDNAVSGRGDAIPAENHAEPAQCLLESVWRKIEAGVLSQEGQDLASDQPDQL